MEAVKIGQCSPNVRAPVNASPSPSGFTLIELLVVIAIIALRGGPFCDADRGRSTGPWILRFGRRMPFLVCSPVSQGNEA
jgi:prepilin-type N-terminal cleavage/methylation domain-containing protein